MRICVYVYKTPPFFTEDIIYLLGYKCKVQIQKLFSMDTVKITQNIGCEKLVVATIECGTFNQ